MFLLIRDIQREPLDKGKGKVGKVRVELLPHHLLHPHERGKREMKMEELLPLPLKQRAETLPLLVYLSLLARPDMKLLGHRYKRWDIRVFHTKTLGVPVASNLGGGHAGASVRTGSGGGGDNGHGTCANANLPLEPKRTQ